MIIRRLIILLYLRSVSYAGASVYVCSVRSVRSLSFRDVLEKPGQEHAHGSPPTRGLMTQSFDRRPGPPLLDGLGRAQPAPSSSSSASSWRSASLQPGIAA